MAIIILVIGVLLTIGITCAAIPLSNWLYKDDYQINIRKCQSILYDKQKRELFGKEFDKNKAKGLSDNLSARFAIMELEKKY